MGIAQSIRYRRKLTPVYVRPCSESEVATYKQELNKLFSKFKRPAILLLYSPFKETLPKLTQTISDTLGISTLHLNEAEDIGLQITEFTQNVSNQNVNRGFIINNYPMSVQNIINFYQCTTAYDKIPIFIDRTSESPTKRLSNSHSFIFADDKDSVHYNRNQMAILRAYYDGEEQVRRTYVKTVIEPECSNKNGILAEIIYDRLIEVIKEQSSVKTV